MVIYKWDTSLLLGIVNRLMSQKYIINFRVQCYPPFPYSRYPTKSKPTNPTAPSFSNFNFNVFPFPFSYPFHINIHFAPNFPPFPPTPSPLLPPPPSLPPPYPLPSLSVCQSVMSLCLCHVVMSLCLIISYKLNTTTVG